MPGVSPRPPATAPLHSLVQPLAPGPPPRPRPPLSLACPGPRAASAAAMSKELRARQDEILGCHVMWEPDGKGNTQMDRFRAAVSAAHGLALGECARGPRAPATPLGGRGTAWRSRPPPGDRDASFSWTFLSGPLLVVWSGLRMSSVPPLGVGGASGLRVSLQGVGRLRWGGVGPLSVRGVTPFAFRLPDSCLQHLPACRAPSPWAVPPLVWNPCALSGPLLTRFLLVR